MIRFTQRLLDDLQQREREINYIILNIAGFLT